MRQINNFKKWLLKQKLIRAHADIQGSEELQLAV